MDIPLTTLNTNIVTHADAALYVTEQFEAYVDKIQQRIDQETFSPHGISLFTQRQLNLLPGKTGIAHARHLLRSLDRTQSIKDITIELTNPAHKLGERSRLITLECLNYIFKTGQFTQNPYHITNDQVTYTNYFREIHDIFSRIKNEKLTRENIQKIMCLINTEYRNERKLICDSLAYIGY